MPDNRSDRTPSQSQDPNLPRSLTWAEDIGTMNMSQPQNMVNAPAGSGTVVNVTVNRSEENAPRTNAEHDPAVHEHAARADHEIYCSQLLIKKRGYPLWVPGPGRQLPIEYRRLGISIGDVGIITSDGLFDFLFNIFLPSDHPINLGVTPPEFSHLSLPELVRGIRENIVYGPDTFLASSFVRKTTLGETVIGHRFESTATEAAILAMPDGTTTKDLLNTAAVRSTISRNAKEWYVHVRNTCGRAVKNGDIRVVVGVDKVRSWGIATSSCTTGQTSSYIFKHDPVQTYKWDCIGGSGRVGPQKIEIHDLMEDDTAPQNQCVFVRTINFTTKGKTRYDFPSQAVQQSKLASDKSGGRDPNSGRSRGRPRGGRRTSGGGGSTSGHSSSSAQGSLHCSPSVIFEPVELGVVNHPSTAVHNYLHEKFPDANLVITEDMDWISVLDDKDVIFPGPETLYERILKVYELLNHEGVIQFVRKDDQQLPSGSKILGKATKTTRKAPKMRRIPKKLQHIPSEQIGVFYASSSTSPFLHPSSLYGDDADSDSGSDGPGVATPDQSEVASSPFYQVNPYLPWPEESIAEEEKLWPEDANPDSK